jgi:hypothetical protein
MPRNDDWLSEALTQKSFAFDEKQALLKDQLGDCGKGAGLAIVPESRKREKRECLQRKRQLKKVGSWFWNQTSNWPRPF